MKPFIGSGVARMRLADYAFMALMGLINFEYLFVRLWGFDTIFKPYRVWSLVFGALFVLPVITQFSKHCELSKPLLFIAIYGLLITGFHYLIGGLEFDAVIDSVILLATLSTLTICALAITSLDAVKFGFWFFCLAIVLNIGFAYSISGQTSYRMNGFYKNPNHLCAAIGIAILGVLFLLPLKFRILKLPLTTGLGIAAIITGSRGALAALAFVILLSSTASSRARLLLISLTLICSLCYWLFGGQLEDYFGQMQNGRLADRFSTDEITRAAGRLTTARSAISLGSEWGFIGIGINQYKEFHLDQLRKLGWTHDNEGIALGTHNFFISLIVEWGLPSLIMFFVFMNRLYRFSSKFAEPEEKFVYYSLILYLIFGLSTDLFMVPMFFVLIGLAMKIVVLNGNKEMNTFALEKNQ